MYRLCTEDPELAVRDNNLSFKARGIVVWLRYVYCFEVACGLRGYPDGYVTIHDLMCASRDGRESVRAGLNELVQAGYIEKFDNRGPDGRFVKGGES